MWMSLFAEAVAYAANCLDQVARRAKFTPDLHDVLVERTRAAGVVHAPHLIEQGVT